MRLRLGHCCVLVVGLSVAFSHAAGAAPASTGERLIRYYGKADNYRRVKRDVLRWHKTTRNGCVAFASTALRHVGFAVPERGKRDGYGISRITFTFSAFLMDKGWHRIARAHALRPGDLVFTTGYPDHVFVFHSWRNRRRRIARVLDNRGFLIRRALFPPKGARDAAFAYALRAPPVTLTAPSAVERTRLR